MRASYGSQSLRSSPPAPASHDRPSWSDELTAQTREMIANRDTMTAQNGQLCLKRVPSGFGAIAEDDLLRGVIKVVDRRTGAETIFADADALIAAGWAID
jgi:hypothetical protein